MFLYIGLLFSCIATGVDASSIFRKRFHPFGGQEFGRPADSEQNRLAPDFFSQSDLDELYAEAFGWRHLEVMSFSMSMSMSMSMSAYIPSDRENPGPHVDDTDTPTISPVGHPSSPPTISESSPTVTPSGTPTEVKSSSPTDAEPVSGSAITCDGAQMGANNESVEIEFNLAAETTSDSAGFYGDLQSTMINHIAESLGCVATTIARHLEVESFTPLALELASEESPTKSDCANVNSNCWLLKFPVKVSFTGDANDARTKIEEAVKAGITSGVILENNGNDDLISLKLVEDGETSPVGASFASNDTGSNIARNWSIAVGAIAMTAVVMIAYRKTAHRRSIIEKHDSETLSADESGEMIDFSRNNVPVEVIEDV